jgi:hypothetical protein
MTKKFEREFLMEKELCNHCGDNETKLVQCYTGKAEYSKSGARNIIEKFWMLLCDKCIDDPKNEMVLFMIYDRPNGVWRRDKTHK